MTHATRIEALERLSRRAGLRPGITLSRCAQASSPLVLGSREICLPERADGLDIAALEAVLAHEIAHIERRDGLWLYGAFVLQALFWFQPLNRRARAALQESAELAADARAVDLTGDALGLARTLTLIASWVSSAEPAPFVAMARADSPMVERVTRLVEDTADAKTADDPASIDADIDGKRLALSDGEASVVPNAVAFRQSIANLALAEHRLGESIRRIEQRLAAQGAPGTAQPELERLRCEFAETAASRVRLTREFEARMRAPLARAGVGR